MDWGFKKKSLGIDIGVSSIKVVEVSSIGKKRKLENYAQFQFPEKTGGFKAFDEENLLPYADEVAEILSRLLKQVGIKTKKAAFALPDFSTFFTTFTLPPMTEDEIPQAVQFEARHYIPIPLSEVTFDWQIIEKQEVLPGMRIKVLLVAVPNRVLESYQRIATLCQLQLTGMEAEVFGLVRSAVPSKQEKAPFCLVDFGWQSTTVSVIENNMLKMSHSFDISSTSLTGVLADKLKISFEEAEKAKKEFGLDPNKPEIFKALSKELDGLALDIEKVCNDFQKTEGREVNGVILCGGTAWLFGLKDYLNAQIKKEVKIVEPFSNFQCPSSLDSRLKQIGPSFAVALGIGMMGSEI